MPGIGYIYDEEGRSMSVPSTIGNTLKRVMERSSVSIEDRPECLYPEKKCEYLSRSNICGANHYCEYAEELR